MASSRSPNRTKLSKNETLVLDFVNEPEEIQFAFQPYYQTTILREETGELKTAFQIGFVIFIPFLIIDMVVASTLMAMGMMMLPPVMISLPFKILLFVLVDGWYLIIESLLVSF